MNNGNPSRLYANCLNYLCNNLDLVCEPKLIYLTTTNNSSSSSSSSSSSNQQQQTKADTAAAVAVAAVLPLVPFESKQINLQINTSSTSAAYAHHHHHHHNHGHKKSNSNVSNNFNNGGSNNQQQRQFVKSYQFKDCISNNSSQHQQQIIRFNHVITQDLLECLCENAKLNDQTLGLFSNKQTCLKSVNIKNAFVSKEILQLILREHQIVELKINNIAASTDETATDNNSSSNLLTIDDLLKSLNEWSIQHLKYLNVARNSSLFSSILLVSNVNRLTNLQKLNVSFTNFNNQCLDIITQDLTNLEHLDMSGTRVSDLSPLVRLKDKLKHLFIYNLRSSMNDEVTTSVICSLQRLQQLDISRDICTRIFSDISESNFNVNLFLAALTRTKLDELKYLDISGKTDIQEAVLLNFIDAYPKLKFLGLALTNAHSFDFFTKPAPPQPPTESSQKQQHQHQQLQSLLTAPTPLHASYSSPSLSSLAAATATAAATALTTTPMSNLGLKFNLSNLNLNLISLKNADLIVTGESTESQLIASLKHYKTRQFYVQRALIQLYEMTKYIDEIRLDLIMLVAELAQLNAKHLNVVLAATTCIFNFTTSGLASRLAAPVRAKLINMLCCSLMPNFPNNLVFHKNCLWILNNERMMNNCCYNRLECVRAMLDCLALHNNDQFAVWSSVEVCWRALLTMDLMKQRRAQLNRLAQPKYMQKLLRLVNAKLQESASSSPSMALAAAAADEYLLCLMDILIILTESSDEWSCNFLTQNGLSVCSTLLTHYKESCTGDSQSSSAVLILTKTLELIYNLSELAQIRTILFSNHYLISMIRELLGEQTETKIVFLCVGFFVNLLATMPGEHWDWEEAFKQQTTLRPLPPISSLEMEFRLKIEAIIDSWLNAPASLEIDIELKRRRQSSSYQHLVELTNLAKEPLAQLWSLLAIHNICRLNSLNYHHIDENFAKRMMMINSSSSSTSSTCSKVDQLIQRLSRKQQCDERTNK